MSIVSAGMHFPVMNGSIRHISRFLHGKGIHISTQCNRWPRLTSDQISYNTGLANAGFDIHAIGLQFFSNQSGSAMDFKPQFRVFVNITTCCNNFITYSFNFRADVYFHGILVFICVWHIVLLLNFSN